MSTRPNCLHAGGPVERELFEIALAPWAADKKPATQSVPGKAQSLPMTARARLTGGALFRRASIADPWTGQGNLSPIPQARAFAPALAP